MWVCDPVDGTAMYARHIPVAVFSLALVIDGNPVIGVVYDPFTNNMYSAIKGNGAYKNEEMPPVSAHTRSGLMGLKTSLTQSSLYEFVHGDPASDITPEE